MQRGNHYGIIFAECDEADIVDHPGVYALGYNEIKSSGGCT
jgi:hypothetical protein